MTPTTVGWVLADGADTDGATLAHEEFTVGRHGGGIGAGNTGNASAEAAAAVLQLRTLVEAQGLRLRGVGVTWSADAAAEAALLLESLTDAELDNVVPVRFRQAAESLTDGLDAAEQPEHAAVCVIEPDMVTVLRHHTGDGTAPTVTRHVDSNDALTDWLRTLFSATDRRPGTLIICGPDADGLDELAAELEGELGLPVVVAADPQRALAHGAALALEPGAEFAGAELHDAARSDSTVDDVDRVDPRTLSYAGALAMLVAGVLTFVVSLSMALSLQFTPGTGAEPVEHVAKAASAERPSIVKPTVVDAQPVAPAAQLPTESVEMPATFESMREEMSSPSEGAAAPVDAAVAPRSSPQPGVGRSLLNRVLNHIPGLRGR